MTTDQTAALLQHLEEQLLQPATRSNPEAVVALLSNEFREFGSSGRIYTKPEIIAQLATESPRIITLTDFACSFPSPEVALVTYRSTRSTPGNPDFHALRSSIWTLQQGRWQLLFHQGTNITNLSS